MQRKNAITRLPRATKSKKQRTSLMPPRDFILEQENEVKNAPEDVDIQAAVASIDARYAQVEQDRHFAEMVARNSEHRANASRRSCNVNHVNHELTRDVLPNPYLELCMAIPAYLQVTPDNLREYFLDIYSRSQSRPTAPPQIITYAVRSDAVNETCAICLSDFVEQEEVRVLPCFHKFHPSEIAQWLKQNSSCPLCKTVV